MIDDKEIITKLVKELEDLEKEYNENLYVLSETIKDIEQLKILSDFDVKLFNIILRFKHNLNIE